MQGFPWDESAEPRHGPRPGPQPPRCLSDDEVEQFVSGRLSEEIREQAETHLLACHECLDRVEAEETFATAFRQVAQEQRLAERYRNPAAGRWGKVWQAALEALASGWRRPTLAYAALPLLVLALWLPLREQSPSGTALVSLAVERSADLDGGAAPAGPALELGFDLTELPPLAAYQAEVVDGANRQLAAAQLAPSGGRLQWQTGRSFKAGQYWVRLYADAGKTRLLREFPLSVR